MPDKVNVSVAEEKQSGGGISPPPESGKNSSVVAVMVMPRLSFSDTWYISSAVCQSLGIPIHCEIGTFYEQQYCRAWKWAVESGYDYILNIEYDCVFRSQDILDMMGIMLRCPDIDCLFPACCRRGRQQEIMATCRQDNGSLGVIGVQEEPFDGDLIRCATGHFNLTLIRAASLAKLPHPWIQARPNGDNQWEDGRVDPDISFWMKAEEAGWKVYLAAKVRVGHMQQVITWPTEKYEHVQQYIGDYTNGPPEGLFPETEEET